MAWAKFSDKTIALPCGMCGADVPRCHPDAKGALCGPCRILHQQLVREATRRIRQHQAERAKQARRERGRRAHIPNQLRHEVYERDGYACLHCGALDHDGSDFPPKCARDAGHDGKHHTVIGPSWPAHWRHEWDNKETT